MLKLVIPKFIMGVANDFNNFIFDISVASQPGCDG